MAEKVTRIAAIKKFFQEGTTRPLESSEVMAFWKALTDAEKAEFSEAAAKQLGVELATAAGA